LPQQAVILRGGAFSLCVDPFTASQFQFSIGGQESRVTLPTCSLAEQPVANRPSENFFGKNFKLKFQKI
jgi:hypothetical protein